MKTIYEFTLEDKRDKKNTVSDGDKVHDSFLIRITGGVPKVGQKVKYLPVDSNDWKAATILSHAGKATGMYSNWLNIQDDGCDPKSKDWISGVKQWAEVPQDCVNDTLTLDSNEVFLLISRQNDKDVLQTKQMELEK